MKYLKLFEDKESDIEILKKAQSIMSWYKDGPGWNNVISTLNENEIEYYDWDDFDVLIYYLQNYSE